jgi:hypothetical protein
MLTELLVRTADLVEAEGRVLRAMVRRTGLSLGLIGAASALLACGIALLGGALFVVIRGAWGLPAAAAVCGAALVLAAAGLLVAASRVCR